MAKLSEEEAAQLKALQEKAEAPDEPKGEGGGGLSRVVNVSVDLADPEQVKRALGLGLLSEAEVVESEGGEEDEPEEEPQRRGYFKDK